MSQSSVLFVSHSLAAFALTFETFLNICDCKKGTSNTPWWPWTCFGLAGSLVHDHNCDLSPICKLHKCNQWEVETRQGKEKSEQIFWSGAEEPSKDLLSKAQNLRNGNSPVTLQLSQLQLENAKAMMVGYGIGCNMIQSSWSLTSISTPHENPSIVCGVGVTHFSLHISGNPHLTRFTPLTPGSQAQECGKRGKGQEGVYLDGLSSISATLTFAKIL